MKNKRFLIAMLVVISLVGLSLSGCTLTGENTVAYGEVTAVDGSDITVALGTLNEATGTPPGENTKSGTQPDESKTTETAADETPPTPPEGDGINASGTPPEGVSGEMPEILTLTGETEAIALSDAIVITQQAMFQTSKTSTDSDTRNTASNVSGTTADIAVGSILKITYKLNSEEIDSIQIMSMTQPGGTQPNTAVTEAIV